MMKRYYFAAAILITGLLVTSCGSNKGLEKRVVKLEEKVEKLSEKIDKEGGKNQSSPASMNKQDSPLAEKKSEESGNKEPQGPVAEIDFQEMSHDFGTITAGEKVRHTFEFKNPSDVPLTINDASASCGCTVPSWPKEPVKPGESGEIEVEFNSSGKSGIQKKNVTIKANTKPQVTKLNIKANVKKPEGKKKEKEAS